MYIFPTVLRPIFQLFLKSRNLNDLIMSPKIHSTDVLTVLMDLLYAIMSGVSTAPLKGDFRCRHPFSCFGGRVVKHGAE